MSINPVSTALVSNTLLCEASRVLNDGANKRGQHFFAEGKPEALRLIDLFSTIEAATLYDKIYTLPAKLNLSGEKLELRERLISEGIASELELSSDHLELSKLIVEGLSRVKNPVILAGSAEYYGKPIDYQRRIRADIERFFDANTDRIVQNHRKMLSTYNPDADLTQDYLGYGLPANLFDANDFSVGGGGSNEILESEDFDEFGRRLIGWIHYSSSGAYEFCTSILRDMYYIYTAEFRKIPYWPQSTRVEFARNFPNYIEKGVRTKLYLKLARELGTSLENIQEVFGTKSLFIPPFAALVLDRSKTSQDIPDKLCEVRQEYIFLRYDMSDLESEMREATTFGQMQKVAKKHQKLSDSIADKFGRSNFVNVEKGIKLIPEIIKPALFPADPTKYGASLLLQPLEWFLEAVRNRPIAMFFDLKSKYEAISSYEGLVKKVFQAEIRDVDHLKWLLHRLRRRV